MQPKVYSERIKALPVAFSKTPLHSDQMVEDTNQLNFFEEESPLGKKRDFVDEAKKQMDIQWEDSKRRKTKDNTIDQKEGNPQKTKRGKVKEEISPFAGGISDQPRYRKRITVQKVRSVSFLGFDFLLESNSLLIKRETPKQHDESFELNSQHIESLLQFSKEASIVPASPSTPPPMALMEDAQSENANNCSEAKGRLHLKELEKMQNQLLFEIQQQKQQENQPQDLFQFLLQNDKSEPEMPSFESVDQYQEKRQIDFTRFFSDPKMREIAASGILGTSTHQEENISNLFRIVKDTQVMSTIECLYELFVRNEKLLQEEIEKIGLDHKRDRDQLIKQNQYVSHLFVCLFVLRLTFFFKTDNDSRSRVFQSKSTA